MYVAVHPFYPYVRLWDSRVLQTNMIFASRLIQQRHSLRHLDYPPAMAPRMSSGSFPETTASGNGASTLPCLAARLIAGGRAADTPAAAIEWGTWPQQRVITGTLATLPDLASAAHLSSPATIVVGEVVALRDRLRVGSSE